MTDSKLVRTVLDVVTAVEQVKHLSYCDQVTALKLRQQLYLETLRAIASRSEEEYARDMATEALLLEDLCL